MRLSSNIRRFYLLMTVSIIWLASTAPVVCQTDTHPVPLPQKSQYLISEAQRHLDIIKRSNLSSEKILNLKISVKYALKAAEQSPDNPQVIAIIDELESLHRLIVSESLNTVEHLLTEERLESLKKAFQLLESLLELEPDNSEALALRDMVLNKLHVKKEQGLTGSREERMNMMLTSLYRRGVKAMRECDWDQAVNEIDKTIEIAPWFTLPPEEERGWARLPAWKLQKIAEICCSVQESLRKGCELYGLEDKNKSNNLDEAFRKFHKAIELLGSIPNHFSASRSAESGENKRQTSVQPISHSLEKLQAEEPGYGWLLQAEYLSRRFIGIILAKRVAVRSGAEGRIMANQAAVYLTRASSFAYPAEPAGFKDQKLHYWLGRCLYRLGNYSGALAAFDVSLKSNATLPLLKGDDQNPDPTTAGKYRWRSYYKLNFFHMFLLITGIILAIGGIVFGALALFNLKRSPILPFRRGLKHHRIEHYPEAAEAYETAAKQAEASGDSRSYALAVNCLGVIQARSGKFETAEKLFAKAHEACRFLPHAPLNLAKLQAGRETARTTILGFLRYSYLAASLVRWHDLPEHDLLLLPAVSTAFPDGTPERGLAEDAEKIIRG